jgi:hypothetical protein
MFGGCLPIRGATTSTDRSAPVGHLAGAGTAQSEQAECVWVNSGLTLGTAVNEETVVLEAREKQRDTPLPPEVGLV